MIFKTFIYNYLAICSTIYILCFAQKYNLRYTPNPLVFRFWNDCYIDPLLIAVFICQSIYLLPSVCLLSNYTTRLGVLKINTSWAIVDNFEEEIETYISTTKQELFDRIFNLKQGRHSILDKFHISSIQDISHKNQLLHEIQFCTKVQNARSCLRFLTYTRGNRMANFEIQLVLWVY